MVRGVEELHSFRFRTDPGCASGAPGVVCTAPPCEICVPWCASVVIQASGSTPASFSLGEPAGWIVRTPWTWVRRTFPLTPWCGSRADCLVCVTVRGDGAWRFRRGVADAGGDGSGRCEFR